jgi:hypothetical protein
MAHKYPGPKNEIYFLIERTYLTTKGCCTSLNNDDAVKQVTAVLVFVFLRVAVHERDKFFDIICVESVFLSLKHNINSLIHWLGIFHVLVVLIFSCDGHGRLNLSVCKEVKSLDLSVTLLEDFERLLNLSISNLVAAILEHLEDSLAHPVYDTLISHLTQHFS